MSATLKVATSAKDIEITNQEPFKWKTEVKTDKAEKKLRPHCNFCKNYGHTESECRKKKSDTPTIKGVNTSSAQESSKPQITCYGCGTNGFIKS